MEHATIGRFGVVTPRPLRTEDDWWRVRDFLIATHRLMPIDLNWDIRRWDGWRFHRDQPYSLARMGGVVHIWEAADGELIGAVNPEGRGHAHLQVHPDARDLEDDMVAWAERCLAASAVTGEPAQVDFFVLDQDTRRVRVLERRGYERLSEGEVHRRQKFEGQQLPRPEAAAGYSIRSTRPEDDSENERMAAVLNRGFGRTIHTAAEYRTFATMSPSFDHSLNLVAEAADGSFAAHVGCTYDAVNRRGIFEPVCTHPDHRRRGLALALMREGQHRMRSMGATDVYVDTGDMDAANALYEAAGFTEKHRGHYWRRTIGHQANPA